MSAQATRLRVVSGIDELAEFRRLSRAIGKLERTERSKQDFGHALALLDELTTMLHALTDKAHYLRSQMMVVQLGIQATTAYRRTQNLVPGSKTGKRK
jgi:hypothetical protein